MADAILLVGCGKMGSAMLSGWLTHGIQKSNITIIEPEREHANRLRKEWGVRVIESLDGLPDKNAVDIVVLAVKPQIMKDMIPLYQEIGNKAVFLSIAAGRTISFFEKYLGEKRAIIRAMPNLPAVISKGVTVACANKNVKAAERKSVGALLTAIGTLHWVEDEGLLDAVTAISGSGPAYLFYFLECLTKAGEALGLSEELALSLAYQTVHGSTELALSSDEPASALREQVTSKGGTTEAALKILMADGLQSLIMKATQAAQSRSVELAE